MYRLISFKSHSVMIITIILVFGNINIISSESISIQAWSNLIQDLSLKIHDYKSDDKMIESHPLNEGFILLAHNPKEPSTTTTKPTHLSTKTRISRSHNISSTTCTTIIMIKTKNRTSSPVGHLGRRLLNEPNYNTDTDTTSMQTPIENDAELDNFLKVNDEELSKQLFNLGVTVEASGETTEETTKQTSVMTMTSHLPTTSTTTSTTTEHPTGSTSEQTTGSTPEQPTGSTPEQTTGSTSEQTTGSTPEQPTGSTSEQPTGSTTEQPTGSTSEQITGSTPEQPTGSTFEQSTGSTPEQSTGSTPEQPTGSTPEQPTGSTSEQSTGPTPEQPTGSTPEQTTGSTSEQTTGSTPEQPTGSTTEQPTGSTTEQPTGSTSEQITGSTPEQPTGSTSEQSTGSTPEQSTGSTPEQPTGSTPEQPTGSTSEQSTGSTPEQSTGSTPEQPTGSTTEQPTDSTPSQTTSSTPSQTTGSTSEQTTGSTPEQTTGSTSEQTIGSTIEQTSGTTMTSNLPTTTSTTPLVTATTTTSVTEEPVLSNKTKVILTLNCTDANATLNQILKEFNESYPYHYNVTDNMNEHQCNNSDKINITLEFTTDNNITIVNEIFKTLKNTSSKGVEIFSDNVCGNNEIVRVPDVVTSCFVIEACHWCGTNPIRGKCLPELNVSKCECFVNQNDPSRPYVGEYCLSKPEPIKSPSFPSYWTPIIVGILAGLTGLFLATTFCLWTVAAWRGPSLPPEKVRRLWNLPRAQVPTLVTNENVQNYLNNTISTSSSNQTDSDYNRSDISDTTFFKELDQKMGENLRATITRPNTQAMLASLPSDTISTLSYDPIDELDSIIDNEDVPFHDPLNELYEDNDLLEAINPNIKLPRPNVDSKPTGLFSV